MASGPTVLERRHLHWLLASFLPACVLLWPLLPPWVVPAALAAAILRVRRPSRLQGRAWRRLTLTLTLAAAGGVGLQFHTLLGRDAGASLLLLFTALKLFETETQRDGRVAALLAILAATAVFLFDQSLWRALLLAALFPVQVAALLVVGAPQEPMPVLHRLREALALSLLSLPFALVLFVLFPRISGPLWHVPQENTARSGLSEEMDPGRIARLVRDDTPAFRVRFDGTPPPPDQRYWRGPVMSAFDGRTWRVAPPDRQPLSDLPRETGSAPALSQDVLLEPHGKRWLFGLDHPLHTDAGGTRTRTGMLLAQERVLHPLRYRVVSLPGDVLPATLSAGERRRTLELPTGTAPRAARMALEWRARARNDGEVIQRALAYFASNLSYTLSPGSTPPGVDPTDHFLFESRAGFCEHMAGSFAVLMRAAGIPARVVTGYQGGSWNAFGGFLQVRQSDAHAWTEVWMDGRGWLRVDPTAAIAPERVQEGLAAAPGMAQALPLLARSRLEGGWMAALQELWDSANYQWQRWVLAYGPDRQWALLRRLGFQQPDWQHLAWALGTGLGLLGLGFALWALHGARPRHDDPLRREWRRFERKLARAGLPARAGETPLQLGRRAARSWPGQAGILRDIVEEYLAQRYAPAAGDARHGRARLRRRIRALRLPRLPGGSTQAALRRYIRWRR